MTGRPILTAAAMRAAEQGCGVPLGELMERAGAAVAEAAWRFGGGRGVLVLCGPGNNGGDGYVAARLLAERGARVRVAAADEPKTELARAARARWTGPVEPSDAAAPAPVLVDALFGTGLTRGLEPVLADRLNALAEAAHLAIAVDLPSGVATDDGALLNQVPRFGITLALGALKPAHRLQPAARFCGQVLVAELGFELSSDVRELVAPSLPKPGPDDHKYTRGMVLVVGGDMPGAARLAATAALRAGAGIVRLYGGQGGPEALICRAREELSGGLADRRTGAVLLGPGLVDPDATAQCIELAVESGKPLVIDAGALRAFGDPARLRALGAPPILTPHEGEFEALFGRLPGSKIDRARAAAAQSGAVVALKGADTVIAAPDGSVAVAPPNTPWLATGGTGDVLAGVVAAMRARGLDAFAAAGAGVWLHADAARRAGPAFIADDLLTTLTAAVAACQ